MARIVLTEQQFKDYCRRVLKEQRGEQYLKNIIRESLAERDVYKEQSALEIQYFLRGLENGQAVVDEKSASVPYPEEGEYASQEPERWITFTFDDQGNLKDDNFSMQCTPISDTVKRQIINLLYNNYGVRVEEISEEPYEI